MSVIKVVNFIRNEQVAGSSPASGSQFKSVNIKGLSKNKIFLNPFFCAKTYCLLPFYTSETLYKHC